MAARVWLGILWIVTIGIAYIVGWYKGARSVATLAVSTAESSMHYVLIALIIVAVISAFATIKARGYLEGRQAT